MQLPDEWLLGMCLNSFACFSGLHGLTLYESIQPRTQGTILIYCWSDLIQQWLRDSYRKQALMKLLCKEIKGTCRDVKIFDAIIGQKGLVEQSNNGITNHVNKLEGPATTALLLQMVHGSSADSQGATLYNKLKSKAFTV